MISFIFRVIGERGFKQESELVRIVFTSATAGPSPGLAHRYSSIQWWIVLECQTLFSVLDIQ